MAFCHSNFLLSVATFYLSLVLLHFCPLTKEWRYLVYLLNTRKTQRHFTCTLNCEENKHQKTKHWNLYDCFDRQKQGGRDQEDKQGIGKYSKQIQRWQNSRWISEEEVCVQASLHISSWPWHWLWAYGGCESFVVEQILGKTNRMYK